MSSTFNHTALLLSSLLFALPVSAQAAEPESLLNKAGANHELALNAEIGTLAPLAHTIQFSNDGTLFNYVADGGQDLLFPFLRLSADLRIGDHHEVVLVYQPLNLETSVLLEQDLVVDEGTFLAGSALDLRYGFDFYRASWLYDVQSEADKELAFGLSLQIRDAAISFESADGTLRRDNRDIGPVPILKTRIRQPWGENGFWGFEADGFYAPIKYVNGGSSDVVGAILDASLRAGLALRPGAEVYLNLRYLGGGAEGTSNTHVGPGDGYVANWLHFASLSLGFRLD